MANKRRDPKREKLRDLRRMDSGRLSSIFNKCHPEHDWKNFEFPDGTRLRDRLMRWQESNRAEDEWILQTVGGGRSRYSCGAPPSWFRRQLNRKRRAKGKQAMREQLRDGRDVTPPPRRRDVRWLWW